MFDIFVSLFAGLELCYYLLITQTGIVEAYHSDLAAIALLPLGGIVGTFMIPSIKAKAQPTTLLLLSLQNALTLLYPHFGAFWLFMLGIAVGGLAPLIVATLREARPYALFIALALSYATGTLLFTYDPLERRFLGMLLGMGAIIFYVLALFFHRTHKKSASISYPLWTMFVWVFLDSALFETLSRDTVIPIWREGYTLPIVLFHILGVTAGIFGKWNAQQKSLVIYLLFALSYLFYFTQESLLLSMAYPFVISLYNVAILQSLMAQNDAKKVSFTMVVVCWVASGAGLFVALHHLVALMPFLLVLEVATQTLTTFFYTTKRRLV